MEENNTLSLRALDPVTDIELFREAYLWRNKKPSKLRPDRMSLEDFAANDPSQVVMGLFNGQLCAVYLIRQVEPGIFDTHYSSRRKTPREYVLAGARECLKWLLDNGAIEVQAYVSEHNGPLCRFVEEVGYQVAGVSEFPCASVGDSDTLPIQTRKFVKYAARSR